MLKTILLLDFLLPFCLSLFKSDSVISSYHPTNRKKMFLTQLPQMRNTVSTNSMGICTSNRLQQYSLYKPKKNIIKNPEKNFKRNLASWK